MGFGENLRALRKDKGMSQNELAEILGYRSFSTVQRWEKNGAQPPDLIILKIAHIFGVTRDELISDDPIMGEPHEYDESASQHHLSDQYKAFMPDFYKITDNYMLSAEGHESDGELLVSFPSGARVCVTVAEMDDIIEDALGFITYRLHKLKDRAGYLPSDLDD